MQSEAITVEQYMQEIPEERQEAMQKLRSHILKNLPQNFNEEMSYGMIGYVVPHSTYPNGYHCNPKLPLPFMSIASQKNFVAIYHMGIYADPALLKWFTDAYAKTYTAKLDIGKSCLRFKKPASIPYELIGELCKKLSVQQWIELYERAFKKEENFF